MVIDLAQEDKIKELCWELYDTGTNFVEKRRRLAKQNELFMQGKQNKRISSAGVLEDIRVVSYRDEYRHHNKIRNARNFVVSTLTEDKISVKAFPFHPSAYDKKAAEKANQVIDYINKTQKIEQKTLDVVKWGLDHSVAGAYLGYDFSKEAIEVYPLTIFDFVLDPDASDHTDAKWVIIHKFVDVEEARAMIGDEDNQTVFTLSRYENKSDGSEGMGVCVMELWHLPDYKLPDGLYCRMVGDKIESSGPYPYVFKGLTADRDSMELPIVIFTPEKTREEWYGYTPTDDATEAQIDYNNTLSRINSIADSIGRVQALASSNVYKSLMEEDAQLILGTDEDFFTWLPTKELPNSLKELLVIFEEEIYSAYGVSKEFIQGSYNASSSGKKLAYSASIDSKKQSVMRSNLETFIVDLYRKCLKLVQKFYIDEKLVPVFDEDNQVSFLAFQGADIQGVDVVLETVSDVALGRSAISEQAPQLAQQGIIQKEQIPQVINSGLVESLDKDFEELVLQEIEAVERGELPKLNLNPERVLKALQKFKELYKQVGVDDMPIRLLEQEYFNNLRGNANESQQQ